MENNQVNFWLSVNADKFNPTDLPAIKATLEQMDNNQMMFLQGAEFKKPSTIFLIAFFLGWERFFLDDIGLGIVKIITFYGFGIWWLIDVISAKKRAREYNLKQFQKATGAFGGGMNMGNVAPVTPVQQPVTPTNTGSGQPVTDQAEQNNTSGQVTTTPSSFPVPPVNQLQSDSLMQKLFDRLKKLLITPHTEYKAIAKENPSHTEVLTKYVLLLAIIPFLFSFISGLITVSDIWDYSVGEAIGGVFRIVFHQLFLLFGGIYITSLIINAMAGKFGGQKDFNNAFALVAYAYTPMFLAGIFQVWRSGFSWLVYVVGVYGLFLLIAGLKPMMKSEDEKADAYSTISFIIAVAVYAVLWKVLSLIMLPSDDLFSSLPSYRYPS